MKKICIFVLVLTLLSGLCACGGSETTEISTGAADTAAGGLHIVCTIFPIYDWVKNIVGSDENVTLLLDSGVDLHSYQPTADDIITISGCDLFVYVGGESDKWVDGVLASSGSGCMALDLMEALSGHLREEELAEGMQAEEEEEEEGGPGYDEHIWLSVRNAAVACDAICEALGKISPENAPAYNANTAGYKAKLAALDTVFADFMRGNHGTGTVLFGDRFPFRYFVEDYGIDYYAAFMGCSAESEASFETISFLAGKVDELNLKYIFSIDGSNNGLAETVAQNASADDITILTVDSMQSVTISDVQAGADYVDIMTDNIKEFKIALG